MRSDLEVEALHEISRILAFSADINKAFTSVLTVLRSVLGMENGTVSIFDPVTGEVFIEAAPEMSDSERILGRLRPGEGIIGRIFRSDVPMVIPDMADEPRFLNRTRSWKNLEAEPRAFIGVPIRDARVTLGVLTVDRRHAMGPISFDRDVRFLTVVASMVGTRVRLQQLQDPHHRPSSDPLPAVSVEEERFPGIVTASAKMRGILEMIARVAQSRATVFLRGESGTGKELFAKAIHDKSPRAARPFVALNCAAIPESLLESELFGHEKGAFTGALTAQKGRFEQSDGGTLFLDEVGELPLAAQSKLLRVLQERQFERIGARKPVTVDVRLVAATNRDLEDAMRKGQFRLDLYHRLSVVTVLLPPLRERPEDIEPLTRHFLAELNAENGRSVDLTPEAMEALVNCRWSGNVRQLRNCVERIVVSSHRDKIRAKDLPCFDREDGVGCLIESSGVLENRPEPPRGAVSLPVLQDPPSASDERERIVQALARSGFVKAKAARLLGMTVRQLAYRVRKYGIPLQRF